MLGMSDTKKNKKIITHEWITKAIIGQDTTVDEVLAKMMDANDKRDLKNGKIPFESLKLHVKIWCEMGKPDQNN